MVVLAALEQGDPVAVAKVTDVISGWLAHYQAYDLFDSWDDIIHEVLIRLIQSARRGAIREPRAFISYTGTTTRNLFLDWRQREAKLESNELWEQLEVDDAPTDPGMLLDVQRMIDDLPGKLRRVVEAIYLQGHSYEECAKLLGIPLGTLKRRLTQARKEIRKKMGKKGGYL